MISVVMVAVECTCLAFLLVDLIAYIFLPHSEKLRKDGFFLCLLSLTAGLVFDIAAWACECVPSPAWLQYSGNTLCLMSSGFINSFFAYYITGLIGERKPISPLYAPVIAAVNLSGSAAVLIAALCGRLFDITPHPLDPEIMIYYPAGFAYSIPGLLSTLSLTALFILVLCNAKALGRKKLIVLTIYFLVPLFSAALELINESLQFSFALTCVNMSVVYVMLQSRHMEELLVREKLLNEWSYLDSLTGLLNRRAFDRDAERIPPDEPVSVAFFDLNGLKKVNDEQGHNAGDRYLIGFSELLTRHFSRERVYRISGDEFVVIAPGPAPAFDRGINDLSRELGGEAPIAAFGTAAGPGSGVSGLIKEAEAKMYENKESFYRSRPELKRAHSDGRR